MRDMAFGDSVTKRLSASDAHGAGVAHLRQRLRRLAAEILPVGHDARVDVAPLLAEVEDGRGLGRRMAERDFRHQLLVLVDGREGARQVEVEGAEGAGEIDAPVDRHRRQQVRDDPVEPLLRLGRGPRPVRAELSENAGDKRLLRRRRQLLHRGEDLFDGIFERGKHGGSRCRLRGTTMPALR
jgi:hypothetical protein